MTIRPTYRWSGSRIVNPKMWAAYTKLMNALGMKYVHMVDGRELPSGCANPSVEMLGGEGFLGRQKHERDGAYVYWGEYNVTNNYDEELFYDMRILDVIHSPKTASLNTTPEDYFADKETIVMYRDLCISPDMEAAAKQFMKQLSVTRYDAIRHTGPATLFKYFYQSGYSWVGAELMYGPMELVIAALRGAAKCYNSLDMGGHLAVQWSSTPHDTIERYRRYRLALYISYIQGLTEINTEEGLWRLEEYYSSFHRFSTACQTHLCQQQDFYRYISTHSRTGSFYAPIAFLSGRYDGWQCFERNKVWGRKEFFFDTPEESWDLLKIFYPLSELNAISHHPCQDGPVGFYSGTPRGNVNIIPVESSAEDYSCYKVLSFLGYNKAMTEDCNKLLEYLEQGGNLVLGWPHLSVTTNRADVTGYRHTYIDHSLVNLIAGDTPAFTTDTVNGQDIEVFSDINITNAQMIAVTDSGCPLAFVKKIGNGKVYFVNAKGYPAEPALKAVYENIITDLSDECNSQEHSFIKCGNDVQFCIYDQVDTSRNIYLIATDWFNLSAEPRNAVLIFNGYRYPVSVPFGKLIKIVVTDNYAVWSNDEDCDVLSVDGNTAIVQGCGLGEFTFAYNGILKEIGIKNSNAINFNRASIQKIKL